MKKLFTSLLLLGAFTVTNAQVTVTDFNQDEKTVTINYDRSQGVATRDIVDAAIKQAFGEPGPNGAAGTFGKLEGPQRKAAVDRIILTGDWSNADTDKDQSGTIKKIVDEFSENCTDTLDLSQCTKFMSKFVSVTDICNGEVMQSTDICPGTTQDWFDVVFNVITKLEENVTGEAKPGYRYNYSWGGVYTGQVYQHDDGNWYDGPETWAQQLTATPIFVDENNNEVPDESVTDNGDGTYSYSMTITHDDKTFAINKEYKLAGIIFPVSDNFTFIPNGLFKGAGEGNANGKGLKKVVLSNKIVAIGNNAFEKCYQLEDINFPSSIQEIGHTAFEATGLKSVNLSNNNIRRMRFEIFEDCTSLTEFKFPSTIIEIQKEAFFKTNIAVVDLSQCHKLRIISIDAFSDNRGLTDVIICSHPKILRGAGHGTGCFNEDWNIKRVEITACYTEDDPITDITKCYCEIGAFPYQITEVQTQIDNVQNGAKLIFPADMPVGNNQVYAGTTHESGAQITQGSAYTNPYTSAFDFFVGDFKSGVMLSQTNLQVLYNDVPNNLGPAPGYGKPVNQPELGEYVQGLSQNEDDKYVGDTRYSYNGWIEFINTENAVVVPQGKFLRTYSRSFGDGPCLLPKEITAYRAVDYQSRSKEWVQDKRNGTHYYSDPTVPVDQRVDEEYIEITKDTPKSAYAGGNRYSFVTTGGTLYLKPLVAKKAYAVVNGTTYSGYTDENKDFFNSEAIYNSNALQLVEGGYSYVPENTGVVLYSD